MTKGLRRGVAATAVTAMLSVAVAAGAGTASGATVDSLGYDPAAAKGALWQVKEVVQANAMNKAGFTGKGVGVALIDTGVTEVPGLDTGNVVHGPDLSFDSQDPELAHRDAYGHGTHLASIIAGRDAAGTPASYASQSAFYGVAPDVNLVDVKVGAQDGAVDVSQVIAAIDWVVEHRNDNGLNIRVIALAYGTDSQQDPRTDPLTFAVEQAWRAGITVVVAGGNDGQDTMLLANPAQSPYVLAVGAADTQGTTSPADDTVPTWASRGTNTRHVDVVAPGVSVLGARVPNGYADERNQQARVGTRFAKASGTSQATAVVAGEVALLLQAQPTLSPDQVKQQLRISAYPFSSVDSKYRGNGMTEVNDARLKDVTNAKQSGSFWSTGLGSLEASRGSSHVNDGVTDLRGEFDIFGNPWDASAWATASADQSVWAGGNWRGWTWSGDGWEARSWRDAVWTTGTWSARSWRDSEWAARSWRDGAWTGSDWSARSWRDALWSARSWRSADLASVAWQSNTWR
jgi:serine protease AprX